MLDKDKFLAEKRPDTEETDPGKTALPGGHVESGENLEESLRRECLEELGVEPIRHRLFYRQMYNAGTEMQECYYYAITEWNGKVEAHEAGSCMWLSFRQIRKLDLEVDRRAISRLQKMATDLGTMPSL